MVFNQSKNEKRKQATAGDEGSSVPCENKVNNTAAYKIKVPTKIRDKPSVLEKDRLTAR